MRCCPILLILFFSAYTANGCYSGSVTLNCHGKPVTGPVTIYLWDDELIKDKLLATITRNSTKMDEAIPIEGEKLGWCWFVDPYIEIKSTCKHNTGNVIREWYNFWRIQIWERDEATFMTCRAVNVASNGGVAKPTTIDLAEGDNC